MITNNLDQLDNPGSSHRITFFQDRLLDLEHKLNTQLNRYRQVHGRSVERSGTSGGWIAKVRLIFSGYLDLFLHLLRSWRFRADLSQVGTNTMGPGDRTILFFATNGVGLGHLTRLYAIARRMAMMDPELNIIFVSAVPILQRLTHDGIIFHHFPPRTSVTTGPTNVWNIFLKDHLSLLLKIYRPSVLVFDGTYPYHGLLGAISKSKGVRKVWLTRPTSRSPCLPLKKVGFFDELILPGDAFKGPDLEHDPQITRTICKPIVCIDEDELLPRDEVRQLLHIPQEALAVYVQLGAGVIADHSAQLRKVIHQLEQHPNIHTVIGRSILDPNNEITGPRVQIIRDYPNSRFFKGFDLAIMAGGYNSYHEVLHLGLPTICIPNRSTQNDDQLTRARKAHLAGAMLVLEDDDEITIKKAIETMLDPEIRQAMIQATLTMRQKNGAHDVACHLMELL